MKLLTVDPVHPDPDMIAKAAKVLRKGGLVAFPTETVYGLGALGLDVDAVARIYEAKGRPPWNPVILHVASAKAASKLVRRWTDDASILAKAFWPGPLTMVLSKSDKVPDIATAGLDAVAVRVPSHPVARALLRATDRPVAAPSANRFTQISPTTADHVRRSLGDRVDLIIDGGPCGVGIESTVIDLAGDTPTILRPGMISRAQLQDVLGRPVVMRVERIDSDTGVHSAARSPGSSVRHYAPSADVWLARPAEIADLRDGVARVTADGGRVATLAINEAFVRALALPEGSIAFGMPSEPGDYARSLYAMLHEADRNNASVILIEQPPVSAEWDAIHDRLTRAAAIP